MYLARIWNCEKQISIDIEIGCQVEPWIHPHHYLLVAQWGHLCPLDLDIEWMKTGSWLEMSWSSPLRGIYDHLCLLFFFLPLFFTVFIVSLLFVSFLQPLVCYFFFLDVFLTWP